MFPIIEGWASTFEDGAVVSARERTLYFCQNDHKRYYGADVRERIVAGKVWIE